MSVLLEGQVCVVVGAASVRSIGYAAVELFVSNGARVVAVDIAMDDRALGEVRASVETAGLNASDVFGARCDISLPADCEKLCQDVVAQHGAFDCLVNCAALVKSQPLLDIDEADYDRIVDVNLKGTFNLCRSALRVFSERKRGVIVNLASVAAQRGGGLVGGAHYAASKGGVISLTKAIAREFGPLGIRANVICPSMTETGMLDGNVTAEMFREIVAGIPLRRAARPADIAGACLFLASELSAYVTGATLDVNGGSHIH